MPRSKESKAARQATIKHASATGSKHTHSRVAGGKSEYAESELEWVVTTESGYIPDKFHGYSEPERTVSTLHDVSPTDRDTAIEMFQEKMGEAFCGWQWSEMEERTDMDVKADEPGRYEVRCTYHDGGEFCHGVLQRRPARDATATAKAPSALAQAGKGVSKSAKSSKSGKSSKKPSSKTASNAKAPTVKFVWVLTREIGYMPDGFHTPEDPSSDVVTTIPDGPEARETALAKLEETGGEMWDGEGWDAVLENCEVEFEEDTPDRFVVKFTPQGDGEFCRMVLERRESTPAVLHSAKPIRKAYCGYSASGYDCVAY